MIIDILNPGFLFLVCVLFIIWGELTKFAKDANEDHPSNWIVIIIQMILLITVIISLVIMLIKNLTA